MHWHDAGYSNIEYHKPHSAEDGIDRKNRGSAFIGIRSRTQLTEKVLEQRQ